MKRQLALIRFALGSAHRRSGRTLSLVAALALVTFSYASVLFLTEALRREFRMAAIALPDLTVQSLVAGRPALIAEEQLPAIASIAGEVVLGESLAAFLGLEITDAVTLPVGRAMKRLELMGTFRSQVALWTSDVILMSVADAREFLGVPPGQATDLAVRLSTPDEASVAPRKPGTRG